MPDETGSNRVSGSPPTEGPARADRGSEAHAPQDGPPAEAPLPPLTLSDGLPALTDSPELLAAAVGRLAQGSGPVAIDTERASGYRYGQRAYLIQLRRQGCGTLLIDPAALPGLPGLAEPLTGPEWVLHAASQDLPCLAELGLRPTSLFDTELAGRLLGMPRVGLATMVAELLGRSMRKAHGAADWSRRPLSADWLEYAALDVEVLLELRDLLTDRLARAGKLTWAHGEFEAIRDAPPPPPRQDPWRRTSGIHAVRTRRGLAIIRQLWEARDQVAQLADLAPGRILPDSALVAAGAATPRTLEELRGLKAFQGRGAARHQRAWAGALRQAWAVGEEDLPRPNPRGDGPPPARSWSQRDPVAAARLQRARTALKQRADQLELPVENLLPPDVVRSLAWQPPDRDQLASALAAHGARAWQVELTAQLLAEAICGSTGPA